jgi:hypothetical protein
MSGRESNLIKNASKDRTLVLKPIEGSDTLDSKGMIDKRLFTGTNQLHALMDPEYGHWRVKFDSGIVPPPLQQTWTTFSKAYAAVSEYYKRRNVQIIDVIDN